MSTLSRKSSPSKSRLLVGVLFAGAFGILPDTGRAEVVILVPQNQATLTAAVSAVPNGGTIELAAGTYASPSQGFALSDLGKAFTVRAASGAEVYLDGGNARPVLRIENSSLGAGRPIVFERIHFRNGSSSFATIAGGVTIRRGEATFVDCTFDNNQRLETSLPELAGGGVGVSIDARAFFLRSTFSNNRAKNNGGALSISSTAVVHLHECEFYDNLTNVPGHRNTASGGAISVVNSKLFVTNSRFEGNRSGYVGGAIMALGSWADPVSVPSTEVVIANSTFVDNRSLANGVTLPGPTEAGAVHAEDQTTMRIFNSRFLYNIAQSGGAVNTYRGIMEVNDSVFLGNQADGATAGGFGGAFNVISNDTSSADPNRRSGSLTIRRSYVRGASPPGVLTVAKSGGCISAAGDFNRRTGAVTPVGSAASTRATLVVADTLFNDCDVTSSTGGAGGAFDTYLTTATFSDSMVLSSDATGAGSSGGGGRLTLETVGTVSNSTFAKNSAAAYGGALYLQGAGVDVTGSRFVVNEISPGTSETVSQSFGAAILAGGLDNWPNSGIHQDMTGLVSSTVFSENVGVPVYDADLNSAGGWINDERYDSNTFFNSTFGTTVYSDSLACCKTATELNALVVTRSQGNTDKSQANNSQPGSAPVVKDLLAAPPAILQEVAAGDSANVTESFVGYAWSGGSATLDGNVVNGNSGAQSVVSGSHTLSVAGQDLSVQVDLGPTPAATLGATPASVITGGNLNLAWQSTSGDFLDSAMDQGLGLSLGSSGNVNTLPPATTTYRYFLVTEQGGSVQTVTVIVDPHTLVFFDGFETQDFSKWSDTAP